ncbi:MAG TPA: sigma-70 family RNA polymerase sigma factor [Actinomycetes bacterium]|nr:sigma-70 family RNA polymerase sigma factor [Actinomycetes bacterium]
MSANDVEQVEAITDPAARARAATQLLSKHQEIVTKLARIRRRAINDLRAQGLSHAQVGSALGLTRGRIAQLHTAGHAIEQDFFGGTSITITTPLRAAAGVDRPLVAQEDAEAAALLARLLDSLDIDTSSANVSPAGEIDLTPDGLIAICGPKSSPTMREIIATDPVLDYSPDPAGRWRLVDRTSGAEYTSPIDDGIEARSDIAYLARLHRPDGRPFLVIAGVHAIGSLGAVAYLSNTDRIRSLHIAVGGRAFSMVIGCSFTRTPLKILSAEALSEPRAHAG